MMGRKRVMKLSLSELKILKTIHEVCRNRNDPWSLKVMSRLEYAPDLHAADAVYHQQCSSNFRTGKQIPQPYTVDEVCPKKMKSQGRPYDKERTEAFLKVAKYLEENDDEQISISDLILKMDECLEDSEQPYEAYTFKHMKNKLKDHFGERILITEINGKPNVVTFVSTASAILYNFYHSADKDESESEAIRLVRAAAKLIKHDIKSINIQKDMYPSCPSISSVQQNVDYIPESLQVLLKELVEKSDIKLAALGQAIIQASRPRVLMAPLQIGLGIQMHHQFASRFLIETLNNLGFCSSYSEVKRFESCAAVTQGTDIPGFVPGRFVQYVADNVDHNIRTLDGNNTFHGMGIIATVTPATSSSKPVPRISVTADDIAAVGRISIRAWKADVSGLQSMTYGTLDKNTIEDPTSHLDLLWKVSWLLRPNRPAWSGTMQMLHTGDHPGKSSVVFMPMIDMSSSDMSCIYSTLRFVSSQAKGYNVTPIITFDQPLWWKAMVIIQGESQDSDLQNIVLRLGGFHAQMSFLGCIGHLMAGSGLEEMLQLVYATNAVCHMMSGKATARAIRGHFLLDTALHALIISKLYDIPLPQILNSCTDAGEENIKDPFDEESVEECNIEYVAGPQVGVEEIELIEVEEESSDVDVDKPMSDIECAVELLDKLLTGTQQVSNIAMTRVLDGISERLDEYKQKLANLRTAKLWFQYMDMISVLQCFIKGERTGNWKLHMQALSEMLPYLAASGHNLYAKSIYLYLQSMAQLQQQHPDVFNSFAGGLHVVRRSDRYWGGLSSDLIIEQVLMRSMKTTGGLTRGRGMTETQRATWLLSMPQCAEVSNAMQEATGTYYATSEQHKDTTHARIEKDKSDINEMLGFFIDRNPFSDDPTLRNIANGVTADSVVNVDKSKDVGTNIIQSLEGKNVNEYTFKKDQQVVTLAAKSSMKVNGTAVQIDPQLLFQRYITAAHDLEDRETVFKYELSSHPPALFDVNGLMRKANKPALAEAMWSKNNVSIIEPKQSVQYVLDGGSLLQRLPWPRAVSYNDIMKVYTDYVERKYGKAIVVFDGYENGPSTKDATHACRTKGHIEPTINFTADMMCKSKKEHFLSNVKNKQKLINMLSAKLKLSGCQVFHASADADLLIVQKTVESASQITTVLIGEDTDLLVLLCYYANMEGHGIFYRSEQKLNVKKKMKIWNIKTTKETLGPDVCENILLLHAILGCDTTSALYGIGKGSILKKFNSDEEFRKHVVVFNRSSISNAEIEAAGHAALMALYNADDGDLDSFRHVRFCQKVASSNSFVHPQSLPPTTAAARYHSFRVYLQVQQWKGNDRELDPLDWGWYLADGYLKPKETDLPPAPAVLLSVVHCNCKTDCTSARCSCRKHGLECSLACGNCRGSSCSNAARPDISEVLEYDI